MDLAQQVSAILPYNSLPRALPRKLNSCAIHCHQVGAETMAKKIEEASRSLVGTRVILIVYGPDGTP